MSRKVRTLFRVVRQGGVRGVSSVLMSKMGHPDLAAECLRTAARHGRPRMVLQFRGGIGDDVLCTAVLRELRRRDYRGVWMATVRPEIFQGNTDVDLVVRWNETYDPWIRRLGLPLVYPWYGTNVPGDPDRMSSPSRHIITLMCQQVGILGEVALRPYLTLTDAERAGGQVARRQVAIQSGGLTADYPTPTKQWFPERFQAVVDALRDRYDFVQVGSPSDPPLEGVLDLRGKTTLRQTAAILSRSLAFVGTVGLPMHLARAVECRSVIVYGGRELPSQSGYSCNENLHTPLPCSPCWRRATCPFDMECMRQIGPGAVVEALERQLARHGEPLAVDTDVIHGEREVTRTRDGRYVMDLHDVFGKTRRVEALPLPG